VAKVRLISFDLYQLGHGHPGALHDGPWEVGKPYQVSFQIQNQTDPISSPYKTILILVGNCLYGKSFYGWKTPFKTS